MTLQAPDGAYTIGGGAYNFGQTMTEDLARAAFEFPVPTPGNMIELLQTVLAQLPFDALKPFKDFLGLDDSHWQSVSEAVEAIMNSLQQRPIIATIIGIINELERITGLDFSHGPLEFLVSLFAALDKATGLDFSNGPLAFLASLWTALLNATGLDFANGPAAFLKSLFDAISKATGLDFSNGPAAFLASLVTVIVNEINKALKPFFDGITGIVGATWQQAADALNLVKNNLQSLINGIIGAFGGSGTTVANAVSAITNWLTNVFQKLIDDITKLFFPNLGTNRPIADAIAAIGGIFGTATNADTSAANAHAEIEAIKAVQAAGFSDTFEVPASATMSANWKKLSTALADNYGPDGAGAAVGKMSGNGLGWIRYCNIGSPVTKADMKVTATLSRLPWWDAFVRSAWMLTVQNNTTNQECYGVVIEQGIVAGSGGKWTPFYMDAAGAMTNIGAQRDMPTWGAGVPYTLEIKGTTLNFYRNNILQGNAVAPNGALAGRLIGFGGSKVAYTSLNDNPLAQFAGISWQ